jgi:signal transduction histidine kinase
VGARRTVDGIIRSIRTSIFGLLQPRQATVGLQARVMEVIEEHAAQLGFTASSSFTGSRGPGPDEALASMRRRAENNGGTLTGMVRRT